MPRTRIRRYLRHGMLPQLAVFEAVCRLGSHTRAAEELHLAQPTVSTQMKKLAESLGMPLIEQNGKRLQMTEAGRELAAACADVFQRLEQVEERLRALRSADEGRLRVAASSAGKYLLPRLLGGFCERHPSVEVALHIDNRHGMRNRIRQGEDDLYLLSNLPPEPELTAYPILPHPIDLYAPAGHPLAGRRSLDPALLAGEPFILREPGSATRRIAEALFERWGIVPRVRMELAANEAIRQAVQDGLGLALLSREVAGSRDEDGICALDVEGVPVMQQWYIAHVRSRPLPRLAAAFLDYVRANADKPQHRHADAAAAVRDAAAPLMAASGAAALRGT
jgi:DNA-binding transcriptional LysR family regulator